MVFEKEEKIRFQHIDKAGIVFYPRFLEMLNATVEDWFEEALDYSFAQMHDDAGIPTVDLHVQFKSPARLGEIITKRLWVIKLGNSSMRCGFQFKNQSDICLEGEVSLVNVGISEDRKAIAPQPFSESIRAKIKPYIANGV
ncbi:acyl-CoA thioesterase [Luteibaculum oceani]|uniref:Acyl-CoA thioesterase n=1 Tax=Luteibaculum oceani TaxID=1294296 RepID=A0A5C6VFI2_9FLAO|nr:thioesterase family protein [Luteibaculum oceani]TXC82098.1 acyl-CoA thioesterase [Luteibaculum oceani]